MEKEAVNCVKFLLNNNADPNKWDAVDRLTPLHTVAKTRDKTVELLDVLIEHKGNINNGVDKNGGSVLHFAVSQKNVVMVKYLLEKKVETVTRSFHETALHVAADHDHAHIAELLLEENKASVDYLRDERERMTALHVAAANGYVDTCRVLLSRGADVSKVSSQQMSPLHYAVKGSNVDVLTLLLDHCKKKNTNLINTPDSDGRTPLFVCSYTKGQGATDCMRELIKYGALLDVQNSQGNTALHSSALDGKSSRVKLLISAGADLSIKNNADISALHFINKYCSHCIKSFEERLDSGLKLEGGMTDLNSKVKLDFNKLSSSINSLQYQDISIFLELMKSPYKSLLKHPLSEAFLFLKWKQIKYLHLFMIIVTHFIYSVVYTTYALLLFGSICEPTTGDILGNNTVFNWSTESSIDDLKWHGSLTIPCHNKDNPDFQNKLNVTIVSWGFLILFTTIYLMNESVKMFQNPKLYFRNLDSYIDLSLIISFLFITFYEYPLNDKFEMYLWQWHLSAIGCFLTWLQMMFYIGKLPRFGKYVQMFRYTDIETC